jgi:uncharacterized protein (UPF0332 family)
MYLLEAESLSPRSQGRSLVHASYYAMFWLARGAMARREGTFPWRHETTETKLRELAEGTGQGSPQQIAYALLQAVAVARNLCDYDRKFVLTEDYAERILVAAQQFFGIIMPECEARDGPPATPRR